MSKGCKKASASYVALGAAAFRAQRPQRRLQRRKKRIDRKNGDRERKRGKGEKRRKPETLVVHGTMVSLWI